MSNKTISQALDDLRAAEDELERTLKEVCKPGAMARWEMSGGSQLGHIVRAAGDRVVVKNDDTGKEYFIHPYRLTPKWGGIVYQS